MKVIDKNTSINYISISYMRYIGVATTVATVYGSGVVVNMRLKYMVATDQTT